MTDAVKPKRAYRSTRRAQQVAQTRRDIVTAAGVAFRERGYAGVTMPSVAEAAGVGVETIYRAFGSKAGLFRAVIDAAIAGGASRADVAVEDRPAIRAVIDEPDPRRLLALYAKTQPGIHRRAGPLMRTLSAAAATDAELKALWDEIEASRHAGQGRVVERLDGRGVLRPGVSVEAGRDIIWTLCSLSVYDSLVTVRGWTDDRYERWLARSLADQLLVAEPS